MPVQAFLQLVRLLTQCEKKGGDYPATGAAGAHKLTFRMGRLWASCARCDGSEFVPVDPARPVKMTSELACSLCGERVVHGNLIAQLAQDAVNQSRAYTAARAKRRAARAQR